MNVMLETDEYTNECESGWTLYLEQSYTDIQPNSDGNIDEFVRRNPKEEDVDEEEDLSMISDASSGPPLDHHINEVHDRSGFYSTSCYDNKKLERSLPPLSYRDNNGGRRQKMKKKPQKLASVLDDTDTATSPAIFNASKDLMERTPNYNPPFFSTADSFQEGGGAHQGQQSWLFQPSFSGNYHQVPYNQWI